jgi:hypothetical protein
MNCDNLTEIIEICGNSSCDCNPGTYSFIPSLLIATGMTLCVYFILNYIIWRHSKCQ